MRELTSMELEQVSGGHGDRCGCLELPNLFVGAGAYVGAGVVVATW